MVFLRKAPAYKLLDINLAVGPKTIKYSLSKFPTITFSVFVRFPLSVPQFTSGLLELFVTQDTLQHKQTHVMTSQNNYIVITSSLLGRWWGPDELAAVRSSSWNWRCHWEPVWWPGWTEPSPGECPILFNHSQTNESKSKIYTVNPVMLAPKSISGL